MCMETSEFCSCSCHDHPDLVNHCVPCCYACPHCGRNVTFGFKDQHLARCAPSDAEADGLPADLAGIIKTRSVPQ